MAARVFSGIQPTGIPHLGNYFGAISQWIRLANERTVRVPTITYSNGNSNDQTNSTNTSQTIPCDKPIYSIVDIHAYVSLPKSNLYGKQFYDQILDTTASLLALGLDPNKCILFRQSDLLEHCYLHNVLDNFVSTQRLSRMTQYQEKQAVHSKRVPNGLLNYPVLQAADILLYKANYVPVGEDQLQHIELTRDLAKNFNLATGGGQTFVEPSPLLNQAKLARRIKSLRDPTKKMSKSDANQKAFIQVIDEPDVVLEKVKKALTDCESAVYYDPEKRPGVSNLMLIHHLVTGETFDQIRDQFEGVQSADYKLKLADILIEKFSQVRDDYRRLRGEVSYLEQVLKFGQGKAKPIAEETVGQVKHLLGSIRLKSSTKL